MQKLAVNSAKTLADFLFDTMSYQIENGHLKENKKFLIFIENSRDLRLGLRINPYHVNCRNS